MMKTLKKTWAALGNDKPGVTMIEYGLIASLIAVAAVVSLQSVGTKIGTVFTNVATKINGS